MHSVVCVDRDPAFVDWLRAHAWPPALEFLIVVGIATGVCLATYQVFVRHTFIGVVLNGRRGGSAVQPPAT